MYLNGICTMQLETFGDEKKRFQFKILFNQKMEPI